MAQIEKFELPKPKCPKCDKRGLTILPLRLGVADNYHVKKAAPINPLEKVDYPKTEMNVTTRVLRKGYLYVYDEARDKWEEYYVTPDGYFYKLHNLDDAPPENPCNCDDPERQALSAVITIQNAAKATNVWLRFSDVQWTDHVRQLHNNHQYRIRHMQRVNVNGYSFEDKEKKCFPISDVGNKVADYALEQDAGNEVFNKAWHPFGFTSRKKNAAKLVEVCAKSSGGLNKAFAIVLDDTPGKVLEMTTLIQHKQATFDKGLRDELPDDTLPRKKAVWTNIQNIFNSVQADAKEEVLKQIEVEENAERLDKQRSEEAAKLFPNMHRNQQSGAKLSSPEMRAYHPVERTPETTNAAIQKKTEENWEPYARTLRKDVFDNWSKNYLKQKQSFTDTVMQPLGKVHADWISSQEALRMRYNYDATDLVQGLAFHSNVSSMVGNTMGLTACFDKYVECFKARNVNESNNLIMLGLMFNNEQVAKATEKAAEILEKAAKEARKAEERAEDVRRKTKETVKNAENYDMRSVSWDVVYGNYKNLWKLIEKAEKPGEQNPTPPACVEFLLKMTGPISKAMTKSVDFLAKKMIMGVMHLYGGQEIVPVKIRGTRSEFVEAILTEVMKNSTDSKGNPVNRKSLRDKIKREVKRMQKEGALPEGGGEINADWFLAVDQRDAGKLAQMGPDHAKRVVPGMLLTPEELGDIRMESFKSVVNRDVRMGVISGILQIICYTKVVEDYENALDKDKNEASWRRWAARAYMLCTLSEICLKALKGVPSVMQYYLSLSKRARYWGAVGKAILTDGASVIAGVILALFDGWHAWDEFTRGNFKLAGLYATSAVLGLALTYAFVVGWNPILLGALVISSVIVGYFIAEYQENSIQKWMDASIFGKHEYDNFDKNAALEQHQFELAIK